jgi:hypothetical protein
MRIAIYIISAFGVELRRMLRFTKVSANVAVAFFR